MATKDIIKLLPFDEYFRNTLLDEFEYLNPDQKFVIEQIVWRAYRELYKMHLDANLQMAFLKAKNGQEKLDKDFYKRVRVKTEEEMIKLSRKKIQDTDLAAARHAMELIVTEIKAAKVEKKKAN